MTDTTTVKQACDHGRYEEHPIEGTCVKGPRCEKSRHWKVCPGGKEIILRPTTLKDHTVKPDDIMYVEVGNDR